MTFEFKLLVEVDEDMGFDSMEIVKSHIEQAIRDAGDAGITVTIIPVEPDES